MYLTPEVIGRPQWRFFPEKSVAYVCVSLLSTVHATKSK